MGSQSFQFNFHFKRTLCIETGERWAEWWTEGESNCKSRLRMLIKDCSIVHSGPLYYNYYEMKFWVGESPVNCRLVISHWSGTAEALLWLVATTALLYYNEPAQGTQSLLLGAFLAFRCFFLWHKAWFMDV